MRSALRHPFGLALLIASSLLAGAMRFLPVLERWSATALWVLLLGVLAYAASVIALHRTRPILSAKSSAPTDNAAESSSDFESDVQPSEDFLRPVEEALRRLNNPAALSKCELLQRLPGTLTAIHSLQGQAAGPDPGLLDQAQALREALVSAIEQLKPPGDVLGARASGALQYHILHEEYVQRKSTATIMTRHNIAEATFYRNRRAAVSAVADHLETQEKLLARGQKQH